MDLAYLLEHGKKGRDELVRRSIESEMVTCPVHTGKPVRGEFFNWELFASTADEKHSIMLSAMNLRGWLIVELGPRDGDAVLDPETIVAWFRSLATVPIEEAARLVSSEDLRTIPIETLLKLHYIKSALNIVSLISGTEVVQKHPELENWLQLRPRLP